MILPAINADRTEATTYLAEIGPEPGAEYETARHIQEGTHDYSHYRFTEDRWVLPNLDIVQINEALHRLADLPEFAAFLMLTTERLSVELRAEPGTDWISGIAGPPRIAGFELRIHTIRSHSLETDETRITAIHAFIWPA